MLAIVVALALVAPLATAHLPHARGSIQRFETERAVSVESAGTRAFVNLTLVADIERDAVFHVIDPAKGLISVSYRASPPDAATRFEQRWMIERVLEYHDANQDGRYQPGVDGQVRSWRLSNYQWTHPAIQNATLGGVAAHDIAWVGRLPGAPNVTIEAVVAGKPITDEGANARSQDVLIYLTMSDFPPRVVGDLFVIETTLGTWGSATVSEEVTSNVTTDIALVQGQREGFIDWGGSALVDGREGAIHHNLGEPVRVDAEYEMRSLLFDLPRFDRSLRLVIVSAVEYDNSGLQKTPDIQISLVVAGLAVLAALRRFKTER